MSKKKQWAKAGKDNVRGVLYHTIQFPPSTVNGTQKHWKEWHMGHISTSVIAVARACAPWYTAGFALSSPERGKMIASEHAAIHYLKRQASDSRASSIHTFLSGHGVDLWAASVYTAAPCRAAYPRERKRPRNSARALFSDKATVSDDACLLMTFLKACLPDLKKKKDISESRSKLAKVYKQCIYRCDSFKSREINLNIYSLKCIWIFRFFTNAVNVS